MDAICLIEVTARTTTGRSTVRLSWVHDPEVAWLIGANEHQGVRYFNRELFDRLIWWMALRPLLEAADEAAPNMTTLQGIRSDVESRCQAALDAGYRIELLMEAENVL